MRDDDEAIAFYPDVLRFELIEDTPLGGGKRWVLVGPSRGPVVRINGGTDHRHRWIERQGAAAEGNVVRRH